MNDYDNVNKDLDKLMRVDIYCSINAVIIATMNIQFEHLHELTMFALLHTQIDEICVLLLDLITLLFTLCYFVL